MPLPVRVTAAWDPEARVWVAESPGVPGLVAEADTVEDLTEKLEHLIPELLEVNQAGVNARGFELVTKRPLQLAQ
jgi:predicted RNase H-like HicB family nuclease